MNSNVDLEKVKFGAYPDRHDYDVMFCEKWMALINNNLSAHSSSIHVLLDWYEKWLRLTVIDDIIPNVELKRKENKGTATVVHHAISDIRREDYKLIISVKEVDYQNLYPQVVFKHDPHFSIFDQKTRSIEIRFERKELYMRRKQVEMLRCLGDITSIFRTNAHQHPWSLAEKNCKFYKNERFTIWPMINGKSCKFDELKWNFDTEVKFNYFNCQIRERLMFNYEFQREFHNRTGFQLKIYFDLVAMKSAGSCCADGGSKNTPPLFTRYSPFVYQVNFWKITFRLKKLDHFSVSLTFL